MFSSRVMDCWRHDICHVTESRWCHICQNVPSIPSNRYIEAIYPVGIVKKVIGKNARGVVPTPLGVRGLILPVNFVLHLIHMQMKKFKLLLLLGQRMIHLSAASHLATVFAAQGVAMVWWTVWSLGIVHVSLDSADNIKITVLAFFSENNFVMKI